MSGYTKRELEGIQRRWGLRFPPDLLRHYSQHRTATPHGFDWLETPSKEIHFYMNWPFEGWLKALRRGVWWAEWGERPWKEADAEAVFAAIYARAPRLIALGAQVGIPETPHESGNPIFSVFMEDIIYASANLADYVAGRSTPITRVKKIPFWSRAVEQNGFAP